MYVLIELLARGRSHWTMALLGGACFLLIGAINEHIPWDMGLIWQMLIGGGIVTVLELPTGLVVNVWLHWGKAALHFVLMLPLKRQHLFFLTV